MASVLEGPARTATSSHPGSTRLSVVMATFRGGAFLRAQLASLLEQDRRPDEVCVCDDRSDDETVQILQEFAESAPFPVLVSVNATRLGSNATFERALRLARGDLIALSDQDDVWHPAKLRLLEGALEAHPQALLVFSDVRVVDQRGLDLGYTGAEATYFNAGAVRGFRADPFGYLLGHSIVCGMSMLFRRELLDLAMPFPPSGGPETSLVLASFVHDQWLSLMAAAAGPVLFLETPLVDYRQHGGQQLGLRPPPSATEYVHGRLRFWVQFGREVLRTPQGESDRARLFALRRLQVILERIARSNRTTIHARDLVRQRMAHIEERSSLPVSRPLRLLAIGRELARGNYHRHSLGVLSAVADLSRPAGTRNRPGRWYGAR